MSLEDLLKVRFVRGRSKNMYFMIFRTYGTIYIGENRRHIVNLFEAPNYFLYICWNKRKRSIERLESPYHELLEEICDIPTNRVLGTRATVIIYEREQEEDYDMEEIVLFRYKGRILMVGYTTGQKVRGYKDTGLTAFLLKKSLFARIA